MGRTTPVEDRILALIPAYEEGPRIGAVVIKEAIARAGVDPASVGDVILGCVLQAGAGMNVARQAALKAGLPIETPAETVNRVCGSGLTAARLVRRARGWV